MSRLPRCILLAAALASFLLAGCATRPTDPEELALFEEANDPFEPLNRFIFDFNIFLDKGVLRPIAAGYRAVLPEFARDGIQSFLRNLKTPVILLNDILQGEGARAHQTAMRFAINTLGFFGFADIAGAAGLEYHEEDFGQTLAVWGFGEGPYLMLPVLGPSNVRDTVGKVVDVVTDPINWWAWNTDRDWITYVRFGITAVDDRSRNMDQLQELEDSSLDFYAAVRSLYRQRRNDLIRNGEMSDEEDAIPDFDISFDDMEDEELFPEEDEDAEVPQASLPEDGDSLTGDDAGGPQASLLDEEEFLPEPIIAPGPQASLMQ